MLDLNFVRENLPLVEEKLRQRGMDPFAVLKDFRELEDTGYSESQGKRQRNEVPQRGKSENEDEGAPRGKEQADKPAAERKFMHGDAGMPFFGHGAPRFPFHDALLWRPIQGLFFTVARVLYCR